MNSLYTFQDHLADCILAGWFCGRGHLNSNSTVTDVTLGKSLWFSDQLWSKLKSILSLSKIFVLIGKSICIIQFLLALFSLREIQKKIHLLAQMYIKSNHIVKWNVLLNEISCKLWKCFLKLALFIILQFGFCMNLKMLNSVSKQFSFF